MKLTKDQIQYLLDKSSEESENETVGVTLATNKNNVVSSEVLRKVQSRTLNETKEFLSKTFGPMGSNTKIIKGNNQETITSSYSKDGLKVLKNISNSGPIEASIIEELESITRAVEKEVGDGTTSSVVLSALLFDRLTEIQKDFKVPPFQLSRMFQNVVKQIQDNIHKHGRECTLDDIYHISMISTNGNEEVSRNIESIYKDYGMNVDLSVGISNNAQSVLRAYDGLTITEGYSDPAFVNNTDKNTCEIHNASVYHFADPIDTPDMVSLFETIITNNIYDPVYNDEVPVATVITCPRISRDMSSILKKLIEFMYQFSRENAGDKPPLLIITDVVASDEAIMDDIANLCGCQTIHKYIDFKLYEKDKEAGIAPTPDNVCDFAGYAELVVADTKKTKFINPECMNKDNDKYKALINFLETEIEEAKSTEDSNEVGKLKKRLNALKANMVDYLVGGVTVAERDMYKDLVEDAIKNCKSAALYGVGYAANFEGLRAALEIDKLHLSEIEINILNSIIASYIEIASILYHTVEYDDNKILDYIQKSVELEAPYNIAPGKLPDDINEVSKDVLCSIELDVEILELVTKIINLMNGCNQCLLQAPQLNVYE